MTALHIHDSQRKQQGEGGGEADISRLRHWFPRKMTCENQAHKFHCDTCNYPDLASASDWSCCVGNLLWGTTQIWIVTHHQMEYLRLFLRRHIAGKPVMALQSVDWWFSQAVHIMPLIPAVCKSGVDILTPAGKTCNLYYNLCTYGIGYINFLGRGGIEMRVETWIWRQSSCSWELLVLTQTPVSDSHLSLAC